MSELVGILKSTVSVRARWCDNVQACARASCSSWSNGDQHRQLWWLMPYIVKLDCQGAPKRREMDWQVNTNQSVTVQLLQRNLESVHPPKYIFPLLFKPKNPHPTRFANKITFKTIHHTLDNASVFSALCLHPLLTAHLSNKIGVHKPTSIQKATPLCQDDEIASRDSLSTLSYEYRSIYRYSIQPSSLYPPAI